LYYETFTDFSTATPQEATGCMSETHELSTSTTTQVRKNEEKFFLFFVLLLFSRTARRQAFTLTLLLSPSLK
jgi:hypothetical protein